MEKDITVASTSFLRCNWIWLMGKYFTKSIYRFAHLMRLCQQVLLYILLIREVGGIFKNKQNVIYDTQAHLLQSASKNIFITE
jgi:hypothetical protein